MISPSKSLILLEGPVRLSVIEHGTDQNEGRSPKKVSKQRVAKKAQKGDGGN